jgi:hypothetical protein
MKHLKSSLGDLRRLFTRTITVRDIAEPFASFDHSNSAQEVCNLMKKRGFDVVGIREQGVVVGYAVFKEIQGRVLGEYRHSFGAGEVLPDSEPLLAAFSALYNRRQVFINVLGHVGGIVTRGDLQKAPVRLWLFGLVTLLEMQMLRLIRERYPADTWKSLLTEDRVLTANRIFEQRRSRYEENDLSDCLQIVDKAKILMKDEMLFELMEFPSKQLSQSFFNKVAALRDALAHANDILNSPWSEFAQLVGTIESTLERLEGAVATDMTKGSA